jgi:hypothetical protein
MASAGRSRLGVDHEFLCEFSAVVVAAAAAAAKGAGFGSNWPKVAAKSRPTIESNSFCPSALEPNANGRPLWLVNGRRPRTLPLPRPYLSMVSAAAATASPGHLQAHKHSRWPPAVVGRRQVMSRSNSRPLHVRPSRSRTLSKLADRPDGRSQDELTRRQLAGRRLRCAADLANEGRRLHDRVAANAGV